MLLALVVVIDMSLVSGTILVSEDDRDDNIIDDDEFRDLHDDVDDDMRGDMTT